MAGARIRRQTASKTRLTLKYEVTIDEVTVQEPERNHPDKIVRALILFYTSLCMCHDTLHHEPCGTDVVVFNLVHERIQQSCGAAVFFVK